jgi:hypothetical protein
MLPVSAMAEEIHTTIGGSGEIISFAPLTETKKAVSLGTSIEDLELPETLTATVRTAVPADENSTQDSGSPETATPTTASEPKWKETTGDIPVTWNSPDYDPNTGGVYAFTPVIEGYTVSAPLPEISVTVGAAMLIDKTQAREKPTLTAQSAETRDFYIVLVGERMSPSSLGFLSNDCGLSPVSTADSDDYAPDDDGNAMVKSYLYRAAVGQTITFHWGLGEDGFRGLLYAYYADDEPILDATFGAQWAVLRNSGLIGFATGAKQPIGLQFEVASPPVLLAPDAVTNYDIWVGGVQVASDNKADVLGAADGEGATVTYNSDTNTLTLNGAAITSWRALETFSYGIYAPDGLNLVLVGENSIDLLAATGYTANGIFTRNADKRSLIISEEDNGSLTIITNGYFGINSDHLTINSGTITTIRSVIGGYSSASIDGGTVTSTGGGYGIVAPTLTISGGTVTASGSTAALLSSGGSPDFTGMQVTASADESGTPTVPYDAANLSTYKYIKVEPGATPPVPSEVADLTALQSAITGATGDLDLKLSGSYSGTGMVTIPSTFTYNITIDLNGKTLNGGSGDAAISHEGSGTLTLIDSAVGGMVTSQSSTGTIRAGNNSTVNISGGTVSATGSSGYAIYSPNEFAQLNISGGTICAVNNIAIFFPKTTIQTGTTAIIQGGTKAMIYAPTLSSGVQGGASTSYDGGGSVAYVAGNIATYKYLKFGLDVISPVLSSGSVNRTSDTAATIDFTTDKAGTAYYLVVNSGVSAPTSMAVKAGTSLGSVSGTVTSKAVTLTAGAKDIYVVVEDSAGNISTPLKIEAAAYVAPPASASISPTTATFDLNPNGTNHTDIDVTLTPYDDDDLFLSHIKNGAVSLLPISQFMSNGGGSYTLKKSYLSSLPVGDTTITFDMSLGTDPTLALTVEDTRTVLTYAFLSNVNPTFGDTLFLVRDPIAATVSCVWKADDVQVGTGVSYTVKAADIGKTITLTTTGTGSYKGTIISEAISPVAARDYSVTVDSSKSVAQGLGVSSLPTADAGSVTGTLTWYSNSGRTIAAVDTDISALSVGGSVTLYWSFTATTTGYVTTPKTGECVVTIVSGAAQTQ